MQTLQAAARVRFRFDAGTIVVEGVESDLRVARLPGVQWDDRVGVYRAPAYVWPRIREILVRAPGLVPDGVRPIVQIHEGWSAIDLRPYQESAVLAWELSRRRGLVVLPTGSGKTMVALAVMARTGLSTLCLVPTRVLLEQWHKEIARVWSGRVGILGDGVRQIERITVATFESGYRTMHRIGNHFDLLVIDEVHHFGCGVRDEALEMSTAGARLGLTATPPSQAAAQEQLRDLIGDVVYERAVADLSGRFLAPFDLVTIRIPLSQSEHVAYESRMQAFRSVHAEFRRIAPGAPWEQFQREASRTLAGRQALTALKEARRIAAYTTGKRAAVAQLLARHRKSRILIFTSDNDSAYAIAREHLIMPMTCDIGRTEREEVLAAFRSGELRALVSARVLNEGVDVPDADVAMIVSGAMGEREHVQRVGRVLRPADAKRALVYELVASGTSETAKSHRRRQALGGPRSQDSSSS